MSKRIAQILLLGLFLAGTVCVAGLSVVNRGSFYGASTVSAAGHIVIPSQGGMIRNMAFSLNTATDATLTIHRYSKSTRARAALAAASNLVVYTDYGQANFGGITIDTNDSVLIYNSSSGYQIREIGTLVTNGVHTNSYMTLNLEAVATCSSNDVVWFAHNDDELSVASDADQDQTGLRWIFTGFDHNPVGIVIPSGAGVSILSGTYDVEEL